MLLPCGLKINISPIKLEGRSFSSTYHLVANVNTIKDIPTEEKIIQAGRELIEDTNNWKHTKDYCKSVVKGYSAPKQADDEEPWFCRVSEHAPEEASFDEFWFGLGTNKPEHERK